MNSHHILKRAAGLLMISSVIGSAHAGLVTGSADPAFGSALPGTSYRVDYRLDYQDAYASALNSGNFTVDVTNREIAVTGTVSLYETANRANFTSADFNFQLGQVTFDPSHSGVLVSWRLYPGGGRQILSPLSGFTFAGEHEYDFTWSSLDAASELRCDSGFGCGDGPVTAADANLVVDYEDRGDDGNDKLGQDSQGHDLSDETTYDAQGVRGNTDYTAPYVNKPLGANPSSVPEPSSAALVLIAIAGGAGVRRRPSAG